MLESFSRQLESGHQLIFLFLIYCTSLGKWSDVQETCLEYGFISEEFDWSLSQLRFLYISLNHPVLLFCRVKHVADETALGGAEIHGCKIRGQLSVLT